MSSGFTFSFPSIRGVQAGKEYFVSMCPLKLVPMIFRFDDECMDVENRVQRKLNKGRIPEMSKYILENPESYTFSALTASIDGEVNFEPVDASESDLVRMRMGTLSVSMDARFIINDGQHRKAAIERALKERPELGAETIAVVFFLDRGLERCQQMFSDLNKYAVRPSASLGILFDNRSHIPQVTKYVALQHSLLKGRVELERSSLSPRSKSLFTLSALNFAVRELLAEKNSLTLKQAQDLALDYWEEVAKNIPSWQLVASGELSSGDARERYVSVHAVALHALGKLGRYLMEERPATWRVDLEKLQKINWLRSNAGDWEGVAMVGGRMTKSGSSALQTCQRILFLMGLTGGSTR